MKKSDRPTCSPDLGHIKQLVCMEKAHGEWRWEVGQRKVIAHFPHSPKWEIFLSCGGFKSQHLSIIQFTETFPFSLQWIIHSTFGSVVEKGGRKKKKPESQSQDLGQWETAGSHGFIWLLFIGPRWRLSANCQKVNLNLVTWWWNFSADVVSHTQSTPVLRFRVEIHGLLQCLDFSLLHCWEMSPGGWETKETQMWRDSWDSLVGPLWSESLYSSGSQSGGQVHIGSPSDRGSQ